MGKEQFFSEVRNQYHLICVNIKNGNGPSELEKGRFEGFMRAGIVLNVTSKRDLEQLLEDVHYKVFGQSIAERKKARGPGLADDDIDYGQFDRPAIERVSRK